MPNFNLEQHAQFQQMLILEAEQLAKSADYSVECDIAYTTSEDAYHCERGVLGVI